ncbi:helix-turn-helix domain-containing protein, partial [Streptomyces sp. SID7760]|nr:helix-turn-helix domain-containing protein [Streptomyces sp. SID7760]
MTKSVEEPRLPSPKERRRLREAAGLSYEAVATAVGVRANTVRSWESARTSPRGRKREAYAALLRSLAAEAEAEAGAEAEAEAEAKAPGAPGPGDSVPASPEPAAFPAAEGSAPRVPGVM